MKKTPGENPYYTHTKIHECFPYHQDKKVWMNDQNQSDDMLLLDPQTKLWTWLTFIWTTFVLVYYYCAVVRKPNYRFTFYIVKMQKCKAYILADILDLETGNFDKKLTKYRYTKIVCFVEQKVFRFLLGFYVVKILLLSLDKLAYVYLMMKLKSVPFFVAITVVSLFILPSSS